MTSLQYTYIYTDNLYVDFLARKSIILQSCRGSSAFIHSVMFYYVELRIEAVNVGHLNLVRNVPWAAMNIVFPIQ